MITQHIRNKESNDRVKKCNNRCAYNVETIVCPNCGKHTNAELTLCQNCRVSIIEDPNKNKKIPWKALIIGKIGIAVVAVLLLSMSLFSCSDGKKSNYALYLKDSEIFCADLKKDNKARQVTARLVDTDNISGKALAKSGHWIANYTYMSENGKYIFFPDKIDDVDYGFNLYYREVAKPNAEAVKIDSNVQSYAVNDSATLVTYLKGDEGNLYQYKIGKDSKDKIASDVEAFEVSENGKKIGFINSENSIYLKYANKEKEKIASSVSSLEYVSKDFTTVYYIKDGSIYKQVEGADKVIIASDVYAVIWIYDSGEIYYLTNSLNHYSLCFYNGTKEVVIANDFTKYDYSFASNVPVIAYGAYNQSNNIYERYIAVRDTATVIEQEKEAANFTVNSAGTEVYYIDGCSDNNNYGDLYHISIANGKVGKAEVFDNEVYGGYYQFIDANDLLYFKDYKSGKVDMYINRKKIDYDIAIYDIEIQSDLGKILYFTDWDDDKGCGTLKIYNGKKTVKISNDVYSYVITPSSRVLYLYDYSLNYYKGELHEWYNGKTKKIDDDVVCVLPIIYAQQRAYGYSW